ncbi:SDR family NAD(P)-dependent oxidoreductase [Salinibius halmophilus]|uniref:SDR family NAD(P)-dependent oxidoreductase n=1 Tax=Salinibius halmophilus TaxID=1853216 RepID=UPI000E670A0A|nr:SDR family NAD(P)-dependent oxidoreductase [Salinibius halmophilus]
MWRNKIVWVTGGSSGLGLALATLLDQQGAKIVLLARNEAKLRAAASSLTNCLGYAVVDLANIDEIESQYAEISARYGQPQVLINNAGMSQRAFIADTSRATDQRLFDINYFSPRLLTCCALPHMMSHGGHVITVSSMAGKLGSPGRASYAASKHAIGGWMDCLRSEVHARGVRVSVISPDFIATELARSALTGSGEAYGKIDDELASGNSPEKVAKLALHAIEKGRDDIVIASGKVKWGNWIYRLNSEWYHKIIRRFYRRHF